MPMRLLKGCKNNRKNSKARMEQTNSPKRKVEVTFKVTIGVEFPPAGYIDNTPNTLLANALDLTAPASQALLRNRKTAWVQLSGHKDSFSPAGPHTIWKRSLTPDATETVVYRALMKDVVRSIVPKFHREVEFKNNRFLEIEDLLQSFTDPNVMDIKMGTRTFQESEVSNTTLRADLYQKMIKLDPNEPTADERESQGVTKLRYMQFREQGSSSNSLGFRCDAVKMAGNDPICDLKTIKSREQVQSTFGRFFLGDSVVKAKVITRLKEIRQKFSSSKFFKNHEIIGSSLLILHDHHRNVGVWMIDFAKVQKVDTILNHRDPWLPGNHEDGYLMGLDSLIELLETLDCPGYVSMENMKCIDKNDLRDNVANAQTPPPSCSCSNNSRHGRSIARPEPKLHSTEDEGDGS